MSENIGGKPTVADIDPRKLFYGGVDLGKIKGPGRLADEEKVRLLELERKVTREMARQEAARKRAERRGEQGTQWPPSDDTDPRVSSTPSSTPEAK